MNIAKAVAVQNLVHFIKLSKALFSRYPNLAFAEDAPFMLKLREKMGEERVGLLEDVEGRLFHIWSFLGDQETCRSDLFVFT